MQLTRRDFIMKSGVLGATMLQNVVSESSRSVDIPLFTSDDTSIARYQCPDWYRDAKFGIWAVWGPECVPMQGDWFAHWMYVQGNPDYEYHLKRYGHPSKYGYKDIIPYWKAENWNPDDLMARYVRAGAKYFCMIAMHHDNFDCWNSNYQRWNAVNMGPNRDVASEWRKAASRHGLHFGMTEHLAASWWFYSVSKGSDSTGSMAGVPYDGANPAFADLYWKGNEHPDGVYYIPDAPDFVKATWYRRIKDMIDRYHPDLLYSDSPLPYPDEYGRRLLAHFYNDNIQRHHGALEAVYTCKQDNVIGWVQDLERGVMGNISPHPWQTDTCVGNWYYQQSLFDNHQYKTTDTILHMLADIVSKNGNLLLNFPLRPDGTLDSDELKILSELEGWFHVNGEAIFGTRPWKVFGEGPFRVSSGAFNESKLRYTAQDIRFTTKNHSLYAIFLGWPKDERVVVSSLPKSAGKVREVRLLGSRDGIRWTQREDGLHVSLPHERPCNFAYVLHIEPSSLEPVVVTESSVIAPTDNGVITLPAELAIIHGNTPQYEYGGGKDDIGFWNDPDDYVSWKYKVKTRGEFRMDISYSCEPAAAGSLYSVETAGQSFIGKSFSTGAWNKFHSEYLRDITFDKPGEYELTVKPVTPPQWRVIGLHSITLTPK